MLIMLSWMFLGAGVGNATTVSTPADPVYPEAVMQMKAADFIQLTVKDYEKIAGKKLAFKEKMSFSSLKKNLKRELKKNPDLTVAGYLASGKKRISTVGWIAIAAGVVLITLIIISSASDGWLL